MSGFMVEPEPRTSRIAIAAAIAALVLASGAGFLLGRSSMADPTQEEQVSPAAVDAIKELRPAESPVLNRLELLALARRAADALASGTPLADDAGAISGRRFDLILPFGCAGDEAWTGAMGEWSYDEASATLRVSVSPSRWEVDDWQLAQDAGIEAIEGFWIERPWSSATGCPPVAEEEVEDQGEEEAGAERDGGAQKQEQASGRAGEASAESEAEDEAPASVEHTLAVGQVLLSSGPRGSRRDGRPYEIVTRVQADKFDPSAGFRLRLVGRLNALPQGGTVRCVQPDGPAQRPSCFISVEFSQVTIENPRTGEVLGTWRSN